MYFCPALYKTNSVHTVHFKCFKCQQCKRQQRSVVLWPHCRINKTKYNKVRWNGYECTFAFVFRVFHAHPVHTHFRSCFVAVSVVWVKILPPDNHWLLASLYVSTDWDTKLTPSPASSFPSRESRRWGILSIGKKVIKYEKRTSRTSIQEFSSEFQRWRCDHYTISLTNSNHFLRLRCFDHNDPAALLYSLPRVISINHQFHHLYFVFNCIILTNLFFLRLLLLYSEFSDHFTHFYCL